MDAKFNRHSDITDYLHADIDDIIFEYRNKSYGGYLLRKLYPNNMTKANILAKSPTMRGSTFPGG